MGTLSILTYTPFLCSAIIFCVSLAGIFFCKSLMKKVLCLSLFQSSILLFFVNAGFSVNSVAPIYNNDGPLSQMADPVPQVLMLTAIVVGAALTALGFAICVKVSKFKQK